MRKNTFLFLGAFLASIVLLWQPPKAASYTGPSLKHYYRFNGDSKDAVGNADGSDTDMVYSTANGLNGKGAGFNGTTSAIAFPSNVLNEERNKAFSIMLWVRSTQTANFNFIGKLDSSTNYRGKVLYGNQEASGDLRFEMINDNFAGNSLKVNTGPIGWNDGNWHMATVTYDGSSSASGVTIYLDGVSESLEVVSDTLSDTVVNTIPTQLGWFGPGAGTPTWFNGSMDNFAIFNRVLSPCEVMGLYTLLGTL